MSPTKARIVQWFVILLILTGGTLGYFYYQSHAAINQKAATNQGLVGYWSFDEGSGTQAGDASGNGYTGTLTNGPTWVDGKLKKAINFNGTNSYIDLGSSNTYISTSAPFSVSFWMKANSFDSTQRNPFSLKTNSTTSWVGFQLSGGGYSDFTFGKDSASSFRFSYPSSPINKWVHILITYNGSGFNTVGNYVAYFNGTSVSLSASSTLAVVANTNYIGRDTSASGYWDGSLDEFRIYNRALTATEITNLYNLGAAKVNMSSNSNLTNGLVGLWSFDGKDVSGTTTYDRSGNSNNGTLTNGPVVIPGKVGQALSFDGGNTGGTTDYISIPHSSSLAMTTNWSVGAWVNFDSFYTGTCLNNMLVAKGDDPWNGYYNINVLDTGGCGAATGIKHAVFGVRFSDSSTVSVEGTSNLQINTWYHIVGTYDGATMRVYVNGVQEGSTSVAKTVADNGQALTIGRMEHAGFYYGTNGKIDDVRIYNRTLSGGEIRDLYQLGASDKVNSADVQADPLEKGLTGYWKLDENTGTTAADASGNGNTGTLTNGPTWTAGRIGTGVTFDGANDYLDAGNASSLMPTFPFTVSGWVYPVSLTNRNTVATTNHTSSNVRDGYSLFIETSGAITAQVGSNSGSCSIDSRKTFATGVGIGTTGSWQHITAVFTDINNFKIYKNGAPVAVTSSGTAGSMAYSGGSRFRMGSYYDLCSASTIYSNEYLDEVRVYNRVLSDEEVAKLYQTTAPDNPDTSLKGYWSFDGKDISGTTAYDRSGIGATGTPTNGPTVIPGKVGQALSFDGTDDYILNAASSPAIGSLTQASFSFWTKPVTFLYKGIFTSMQSDGGGNGGFSDGLLLSSDIWNSSQNIRLVAAGSVGHMQVRSNSVLPLNVWTHVTVTWDGSLSGSGVKFYYNGVDIGATITASGSGSYVPGDGRFKIGSLSGGGVTAPFSGILDEFRIYSRVLTATEVANLYNQSH